MTKEITTSTTDKKLTRTYNKRDGCMKHCLRPSNVLKLYNNSQNYHLTVLFNLLFLCSYKP